MRASPVSQGSQIRLSVALSAARETSPGRRAGCSRRRSSATGSVSRRASPAAITCCAVTASSFGWSRARLSGSSATARTDARLVRNFAAWRVPEHHFTLRSCHGVASSCCCLRVHATGARSRDRRRAHRTRPRAATRPAPPIPWGRMARQPSQARRAAEGRRAQPRLRRVRARPGPRAARQARTARAVTHLAASLSSTGSHALTRASTTSRT